MDLDAFLVAHRGEWDRLEQLLRKASSPRRLTGEEVEELVALYRRTTTHLSVVQSATTDPALVGRLSRLVARARNVVTGTRQSAWRDAGRFLRVDFPAVLYRTRWWWLGAAAAFLAVAFAWGEFVATHPAAQASLAAPDEVRQLVERDFEDYYSQAPAQDFAFRVWTNNAFIAAAAVASGVLLGLPVLFLLYSNAVNVGVVGGLMAANDRGSLFFGLILPHGMLELTAVFVAAGLGVKLGWTVVDPGLRPRSQALAEEGRALLVGAGGLTLMLLVSGVIEGFVTPSPLPTWARIGIGAAAELGFLWWALVVGRRAHRAGVTGDLDDAGDVQPWSA